MRRLALNLRIVEGIVVEAKPLHHGVHLCCPALAPRLDTSDAVTWRARGLMNNWQFSARPDGSDRIGEYTERERSLLRQPQTFELAELLSRSFFTHAPLD
jgi:hypothetical protein